MRIIQETPTHILIWEGKPAPYQDQVIITSKGQIKRNFPDGSWIGINKRGIANARKEI